MTSKPGGLVNDYFSTLAGTERLCLGMAAAQVGSPEGHLAHSSKNSSWIAEANTHGKAFAQAQVISPNLPASEHRPKGTQVVSTAPLQHSQAA